ncbi:thioredoxin family protein [Halarsenatibacter silvermanii]|uniref:Small redox-active disulfide protein 2 n=1 Tax=Halarsenatibacter silvermanii TaxID=321763 RepID=A0A1G9IWK7_9FIRM|nr:thioredoxin family protein [Halarsenatibacter silvermanii]SDL29224.1 small redox-active disulfide protein 2 [Halarsenatibacter silvermanii]
MKVEVLGPGCKNCETLAERTKRAIEELGLEADFEHIKDMNEMTERGIALSPALVVDGEAVVTGEVPSAEGIKDILQNS